MVFHMKDIRRAYRVALVVLWVSVASATTAKAQAPVNFADEKACPADLIDVPLDLIPYLNRDSAQLPINLEADSIDIPSADKLELRGGAFATQGARAIFADEILFDKKTMSLEAKKAIVFSEQGDRITAVALDLDMETRIGTASDVTLQLSRRDPIPKRKIEDFSALSLGLAGLQGALTAPGAAETLRGMQVADTYNPELAQLGKQELVGEPLSFLDKARNAAKELGVKPDSIANFKKAQGLMDKLLTIDPRSDFIDNIYF